jgi:phosphoglycerate dehydrogenase-like enzyme
MAMYLMLACLRSAPAMAHSIAERRVGVPLGQTLFGKTVLVVGFGGIAKELVPRCACPHLSALLSTPGIAMCGCTGSLRRQP